MQSVGCHDPQCRVVALRKKKKMTDYVIFAECSDSVESNGYDYMRVWSRDGKPSNECELLEPLDSHSAKEHV